SSVPRDSQDWFEIAQKTAIDYIAPLTTTGNAIEWHRLALEQVFINKSKKAIERFNEFSFVQSPEFADNDELNQIKERAEELLDRSEERRVGKESSYRWWTYNGKKKIE